MSNIFVDPFKQQALAPYCQDFQPASGANARTFQRAVSDKKTPAPCANREYGFEMPTSPLSAAIRRCGYRICGLLSVSTEGLRREYGVVAHVKTLPNKKAACIQGHKRLILLRPTVFDAPWVGRQIGGENFFPFRPHAKYSDSRPAFKPNLQSVGDRIRRFRGCDSKTASEVTNLPPSADSSPDCERINVVDNSGTRIRLSRRKPLYLANQAVVLS